MEEKMEERAQMISQEERRPCVILIGMPAAGKSTVGRLLAEKLDLAFLDTDFVMEAMYARPLQDIADYFGKEKFIELEGRIIASLNVCACVIATGGSVVYSSEAMRHLASLGKIVYLEVPFEEMNRRIAENPDRGIAISPNQTLEELYGERKLLYEAACHLRYNSGEMTAEDIAQKIILEMEKEN